MVAFERALVICDPRRDGVIVGGLESDLVAGDDAVDDGVGLAGRGVGAGEVGAIHLEDESGDARRATAAAGLFELPGAGEIGGAGKGGEKKHAGCEFEHG